MLKKHWLILGLLTLFLLIGLGTVLKAIPPSKCLFFSKSDGDSGCNEEALNPNESEITITQKVERLVTKTVQAVKESPTEGTEPSPEATPSPEGSAVPQTIPQTSSCSNQLLLSPRGDFWMGDVTFSNANGEVIVFVHGFNSNTMTWMGENHATQDACNNGFRVAAVNLGMFDSIWNNARLLSEKLEAITSYYGVSTVYIMAHSKGGVETQTALAHYGASSLVKGYITFASPLGGTDLTDLFCSSYGNHLQPLGFSLCSEGAWTVRTGYMSYMRAITDHHLKNSGLSGYLVRGTKCPAFPISLGCILITGDDDGVVPAWSSYASTAAQPILERHDLEHSQVHQTQHYGSQIFSYLHSSMTNPEWTLRQAHLIRSTYSLRASETTEFTAETVTVEGGVERLTFNLLSDLPFVTVQAVSPSGNIYESPILGTTLEPDLVTDFFVNLFLRSITVEKPEAGSWQIIATPLNLGIRTGYLLHTEYQGGLIAQLDTDLSSVYAPNSQLPLSVSLNQPVNNLTFKASLHQGKENIEVSTIEGSSPSNLTLPPESRTYNLELHLTGNTIEGSPFERTLITSLAAIDLNNIADPTSIR